MLVRDAGARSWCAKLVLLAQTADNAARALTLTAGPRAEGLMGRVLQTIEPLSRPILQRYWRWTRGLTLGVRGLVIDAERKVFLITHTYAKGWHLPGGGVEPGETLNEALS